MCRVWVSCALFLSDTVMYLNAVVSVRLCPLESRGQAQRAAPQPLEQTKMQNNADIYGFQPLFNGRVPRTIQYYKKKRAPIAFPRSQFDSRLWQGFFFLSF
ncbi:unnamed protein product, partial [Ectocarpus fasciculatus]